MQQQHKTRPRYEELCTLCYQHTLDPGAVAVKRTATEIGGTGAPSRTGNDGQSHSLDASGASRRGSGDDGLPSPPSSAGGRSAGGGSGVFGGSFSSLTSPTNNGGRESSTGSAGMFGRSGGSHGGGGAAHSSPAGGGGGGSGWSSPRRDGGGNSPVNRGKQFFAKHLRM